MNDAICQVGIWCHVAIRAKYHGLNIKSLLRTTKNGTWMSDQSRAVLLRHESRRPCSLVFLEDRIENSYQPTENCRRYIKYWAFSAIFHFDYRLWKNIEQKYRRIKIWIIL